MPRPHTPNHIDYVEFPSADASALQRSQAFFGAVFDWNYKSWDNHYVDTAGSGIGSGLNADAAQRSQQPLAVIYTDRLAAVRDKVIAAGGQITRDTFSFPGGQRFHFREPGGIELAVWSDK